MWFFKPSSFLVALHPFSCLLPPTQAYIGSPSSCLSPSLPSHGLLRVHMRHVPLLLLAALSKDPQLQVGARERPYTLFEQGSLCLRAKFTITHSLSHLVKHSRMSLSTLAAAHAVPVLCARLPSRAQAAVHSEDPWHMLAQHWRSCAASGQAGDAAGDDDGGNDGDGDDGDETQCGELHEQHQNGCGSDRSAAAEAAFAEIMPHLGPRPPSQSKRDLQAAKKERRARARAEAQRLKRMAKLDDQLRACGLLPTQSTLGQCDAAEAVRTQRGTVAPQGSDQQARAQAASAGGTAAGSQEGVVGGEAEGAVVAATAVAAQALVAGLALGERVHQVGVGGCEACSG